MNWFEWLHCKAIAVIWWWMWWISSQWSKYWFWSYWKQSFWEYERSRIWASRSEWMYDVFIALYCVLLIVYCCSPKVLYIHFWAEVGFTLLNHQQCVASTWMMRRLPQDNGASALTTHQLQVERRKRVIEPIKWMGIIRSPRLPRASDGNLARTPGLHPYSLREVPWDF